MLVNVLFGVWALTKSVGASARREQRLVALVSQGSTPLTNGPERDDYFRSGRRHYIAKADVPFPRVVHITEHAIRNENGTQYYAQTDLGVIWLGLTSYEWDAYQVEWSEPLQ